MDYEANKNLFVTHDGKKVVIGLFEETVAYGTKHVPPFKLSDWRKVYIEACDPTEYAPAMELVGDWAHWLLIRNHPTIKPIMDGWHMEVDVTIRSDALKNMLKHSGKAGGTSAAMWIAVGGFVDRDKRTKKGKSEEEKVREKVSERVSADAERLGLRVVK